MFFKITTIAHHHFIDAGDDGTLATAVELLPAGTLVTGTAVLSYSDLENLPSTDPTVHENLLAQFEAYWYSSDDGDGPAAGIVASQEVK